MSYATAFRRSVLSAVIAGVFALAPGASTAAPVVVSFGGDFSPGTIVVRTGERRLYLVMGGGQALSYVVGVGRAGREWTGITQIDGMYVAPNWVPPPEIRREQPDLPLIIPGGSPANPMGAAALTLDWQYYAIHGTNAPESIGGFVSYGCIRMLNEDIADLYQRVGIGTVVVVTE